MRITPGQMQCDFVCAEAGFADAIRRPETRRDGLPSGVTSKPAIRGHFKTGHMEI
jgi:hypothetical protein